MTAAPTLGAATDPKELWADLAADDAARAFGAVRALTADPPRCVPFLDQQVRADRDKRQDQVGNPDAGREPTDKDRPPSQQKPTVHRTGENN